MCLKNKENEQKSDKSCTNLTHFANDVTLRPTNETSIQDNAISCHQLRMHSFRDQTQTESRPDTNQTHTKPASALNSETNHQSVQSRSGFNVCLVCVQSAFSLGLISLSRMPWLSFARHHNVPSPNFVFFSLFVPYLITNPNKLLPSESLAILIAFSLAPLPRRTDQHYKRVIIKIGLV